MNCENRNSTVPRCHLPTQLKDVSVSIISGALSALEALCDYALYKSTFTLHYIFDVEKCHNLEIGIRDHSRSLKVVPFDRLYMVPY